MDLNWLDDVLVLLEERHMTRAAERRNITQPAFSRRIRSFEHWLGKPILDRKSNRVDINEALAANEEEIRALVNRLREMRTNIAGYDSAGTSVTIAAQHASVCSSFPDMVLRTKEAFTRLRIRLRAGNLEDGISLLMRGDASIFVCYEAENLRQLEFGDSVVRGEWGGDLLVPVVGGALRYMVTDNGRVPPETPAIVYPDDSYFGRVLRRNERRFGTTAYSENPVCMTAFSSGTLEMVRSGLGVGWIPFGMAHREIASGALISLSNALGQEPMKTAIFADRRVDAAMRLMKFWAR